MFPTQFKIHNKNNSLVFDNNSNATNFHTLTSTELDHIKLRYTKMDDSSNCDLISHLKCKEQ